MKFLTPQKKILNITICSCFMFNTQNVVHGDIKPDNLLVTAKGNVKIGDFSVSQIFKVFCTLLLFWEDGLYILFSIWYQFIAKKLQSENKNEYVVLSRTLHYCTCIDSLFLWYWNFKIYMPIYICKCYICQYMQNFKHCHIFVCCPVKKYLLE